MIKFRPTFFDIANPNLRKFEISIHFNFHDDYVHEIEKLNGYKLTS